MTEEYAITDERIADDIVVGINGHKIVIDLSVRNEHIWFPLDPFDAQELANKLDGMSKLLTIKLLLRGENNGRELHGV